MWWECRNGGLEMAVSGVGIWDTSNLRPPEWPFQPSKGSRTVIFRDLTASWPEIDVLRPEIDLFSSFGCQSTRNWSKLTQNWPFFDGSTAKLTQIDPKLTQNWPFFWVLATYLLNNILIGRQWKCRKLSPSRGGYQAWKEGLGPATSERRPGLSSRKMDLSTTLKSRNLTPFFDLISLGMTNGRFCVDHQKTMSNSSRHAPELI
jgi:hypothetical protein